MKKITRKVTLWRCAICKIDYKRKSDAEKCERKPIEKREFKIGDRVTNCMEPRLCPGKGTYRFKGRIIRIFGPQPPDEDYENRWLGGKRDRLDSHVFLYEVRFKCPKCGEIREESYFAPELEKI